MDNHSFSFLKSRISIAQVLSAHGLDTHLRAHGSKLYGPCPLHGGDNPTAFRAHLQRGVWHCFTSCGGGDIIDLICRIQKCSHGQAAQYLLSLAAFQPPVSLPTASTEAPFKPFVRTIPLNPTAPFLQHTKKIAAATALRFEAGTTLHATFLKNTVAVRLYDLQGQPLGYCGRRLEPGEIKRWGKWRFPNGFPKARILYNAHRAYPFLQRGIIVVECPWAVMRLAQAGFDNTVALMGTRPSTTHLRWLSRAQALLLLLDGDEPGRKAAAVITHAMPSCVTVHTHQLPDDLEPEDFTDQDLSRIVAPHLLFS